MTFGKRLPSTRTPSLFTIPLAAKMGLFNALLEYSEICRLWNWMCVVQGRSLLTSTFKSNKSLFNDCIITFTWGTVHGCIPKAGEGVGCGEGCHCLLLNPGELLEVIIL